MRRTLSPADLIVTAYYSIVTVLLLVGWSRLNNPAALLAANLLVIGGVQVLARMAARGALGWRFVHDWFPVVAVLWAFEQLHWTIPAVHSFADRAWDHRLIALDRAWFGDVVAFLRPFWKPGLVDFLYLCYWSYFPLAFVLGAALWNRGDGRAFRESVAVLLTGWYLSYLGYFLVPAVGPLHVADAIRDPALSGWLVGDFFHAALLKVEGEIGDAFPSGHALIAMLSLALAWRHARRLFWGILVPASGLIVATIALRYHYVVDVAASAALAPAALALGRWIDRAWGAEAVRP